MKLIAYDLGTGGIKSSLFDENGHSLAESFIQYETYFPQKGWHEQAPMDWWRGVCASTKRLLEISGCDSKDIVAAALSGHNYVTVPMSRSGELLSERVPIWCDMRAYEMADAFFREIPYEDWYMRTGCGDPPECYPVLKLAWLKKYHRGLYDRADVLIGSKDFVNFKFTGRMCTDPAYAAGFGVFNLRKWDYDADIFSASGLNRSKFPEIIPTDAVVGTVTAEAAAETGLRAGMPIACGAGDNTCMALGARGIGEGRSYTSLGSSSWIAVTAQEPILDFATKPFIFPLAQRGWYTSAVSIFSAGNTNRWVRDNLCKDLLPEEEKYNLMNELASNVPIGSNGLLFNPTLAGGSAQEISPNLRGSIVGLTLGNTRDDIIRACMEGVSMALRCTLDILKKSVALDDEMLICGGGSKSKLWRQIFADVYNMTVVKTNVDQDCASLGAAAIAANAVGMWDGYDIIDRIHMVEAKQPPIPENNAKYEQLLEVYKAWTDAYAGICEQLAEMDRQ